MNKEFEVIFKKYYVDIYKFSFNYTHNKEDSEDILQKVFYKLLINKKIMKKKDYEVKKWLFRVCINELHDLNRKLKNKEFCEINDNIPEITKDSNLLEIIFKLPPIYRNTLYLYYYVGYDVKEISEIINKSISAVKMQLSRGKEMLKKEMEI